MVPPIVLRLADDEPDWPPEPPAPTRRWVRVLLLAIGLGWLAVFAVAAWIDPNRGGVQHEGTHQQLGLWPCNFLVLTGLPCPSCGMTTSFAHLVRGDVVNSAKSNFAGMLLAMIGMVFIPWSLASIVRGRWLWVRTVEPWLIRLVFGWVALMLIRWAAILAWMWWYPGGT